MQLAASVQGGLYRDSERQTVSVFHSPIPTFQKQDLNKKKSDPLDWHTRSFLYTSITQFYWGSNLGV